jgi:hypothetical protein
MYNHIIIKHCHKVYIVIYNYGAIRKVKTGPGVGEFCIAHSGTGLNLP